MNIRKITDRVSYCGVNDRTTTLFENLWELPMGVSYNSYVITGSEHTAIIDGCSEKLAGIYMEQVTAVTGAGKPDYIVVNHVEPDHSGALPRLLLRFPDIRIVTNAKAAAMIEGFYGIGDDRLLIVGDGDTLDLGDATLRFILTPMVHWPETMMTFLEQEGVLFSGDAFGCFGALCGAVTDDETDCSRYISEARRYYACIVAKYGTFVSRAIDKCSNLSFNHICSTHGPVWHSRIGEIVDLYGRMARWDARPGVVIAYGSMYGNTESMAEMLAARLVEEGVRDLRMHHLSYAPLSRVLADVMEFNSIAIVSPVYNTEVYPPAARLIEALGNRGIRRRNLALAGSYSWGAQSVARMSRMTDNWDVNRIEPRPEMKQHRLSDSAEAIGRLAANLAAAALDNK